MKGKYFLDVIDGFLYSTNDYAAYWHYNKTFYDIDVHIAKSNQKHPIDMTPLLDDYWQVVTHNGKKIHRFQGAQ